MEQILQSSLGWITSTLSTTGYLGIFLTMAAESALIPIPSEIIMPFSGFLASTGKLNFGLVVAVGALGNLAGSLVAYAAGFWLDEAVIARAIGKFGRFIFISQPEYQLSKKLFYRFGGWIVFFSRLLPVIRTVISLPVGMSGYPVLKFSILTLAGSVIWSAILAYLGFILGENWQILEGFFRKFDFGLVLVIIILVGIAIFAKEKIFEWIESKISSKS